MNIRGWERPIPALMGLTADQGLPRQEEKCREQGRVNNTVPSMTEGLGWCPTAKSRTKCNGLRTTINLSRSLSFQARPGPTFFFTFSLPPLGWPFFSAWKPPPGLGTQASHKLTSVQLLLTFPPLQAFFSGSSQRDPQVMLPYFPSTSHSNVVPPFHHT